MAFEDELIDLCKSVVPALYMAVLAGAVATIGGVIFLYFDRIMDFAKNRGKKAT